MSTFGIDPFWFNNKRLLGPLGDISPSEYEAAFYEREDELAMLAAEPGRYLVLTMTKTDLDREAPSCLFGASFRLSNAYNIVEQQRGFLQVRGEEGREATLRVYLPCVDDGESAFDTCAGRFAGS